MSITATNTNATRTTLHYTTPTTLIALHTSNCNYHFIALHDTTLQLQLQLQLQHTTLHYNTLATLHLARYSAQHYSTLQYTTLITPHHNYNCNYTTLITQHYSYKLQLQLHYTTTTTTPRYNYNYNYCATPLLQLLQLKQLQL